MDYDELVAKVIELLQREKRVPYRALKRRFDLDDDYIEDLKDELIYAKQLAEDEDNRMLVWLGSSVAPVPASHPVQEEKTSLTSYTPTYLQEKILTSKSALEGERKQVTVLFADIKDSTELIRDLDPEDAQKLLDPAIHIMMGAVHRFEGTVNQVLGDGIMSIFGASIAHEDHAARACYAALAMQSAMRNYTEEMRRTHGIPLQIRVGLNSGEVVVRTISSDLHMDYSAVGQATHLAARMEQLATPGSIVLSRATLRLVEGAELGDFVEGHSVGNEAVRLAGAVEQPYSMAYALACVGLLLCRQGALHMAIPMLERGMALCQRVNIPHFFSLTATVLGTAYALAGRMADALLLLEQTLERVVNGSRIMNLALVLTELSEGFLLVGRVDEASVWAERLRELSHPHIGHGYQAHALRLLGDIAMHHNLLDIDQVQTHYLQALALADELGMRPLQAHCHRGLGKLYRQTGQTEQARAELSTAIDMYRDMDMRFWLPETEAVLAAVESG